MSKKRNKYAGDQGPGYSPDGAASYLGLGRSLNITSGSGRTALIAAALAAAAYGIWRLRGGLAFDDAMMAGLGMFLCFIFSYVVAQELDPDRSLGGIIAGGLTVATTMYFGEGNMLILLWLVFVLRMLNRSAGDRHRIVDNVFLLGSAIWLGRDGLWLYPIITGVAYALESQLPNGYFRSLYLAAIALASLLVAKIEFIPVSISITYFVVIAVAYILFLPELRMALLTRAKGDKDGRTLDGKRLQATQIFFMLLVIAVVLVHGESQAIGIMPAVMAAAGAGIYLVVDLINNKKKYQR